MRPKNKRIKALFVAIFFLLPLLCWAKVIEVGMSAALTGPSQNVGQSMRQGVDAYFHRVNKEGGVNGNVLKLVVMDDLYEPYLAQRNMEKFSRNPAIIAVVGNVGTPTAQVTVPIANDRKILLFGALTGGQILRKVPPDRYVINYRASYAEETKAIVTALLDAGIRPSEIAFFTQDDAYGDSGYVGSVNQLEFSGFSREDIKNIPHGFYPRNTLQIENGLNEILSKNRKIKAFIIIGSYKPVSMFIKSAKEHYPNAYFINVSFVGPTALAEELCRNNEKLCDEYQSRVIITQVVPPFDAKLPIALEFTQALKEFDPTAEPNFVSFEGYIVAKIFVMGLKRAGDNPTRESIIDALDGLGEFDIGMENKLFLTSKHHQASSRVWPTTIIKRKFDLFDWKEIKNE